MVSIALKMKANLLTTTTVGHPREIPMAFVPAPP
jgi:hypothetical protein